MLERHNYTTTVGNLVQCPIKNVHKHRGVGDLERKSQTFIRKRKKTCKVKEMQMYEYCIIRGIDCNFKNS